MSYIEKMHPPEEPNEPLDNLSREELIALVRFWSDLAGKDGLTGVDNRRRFDEEFNKAIATADRTGQPLTVLFVDVDDFGHYNNDYGHDTGDRVLKEVAGTLQKGIRLTDTLFRYGGDEFVILLPTTEKIGAIEVALRELENIRQLRIEPSNEQGKELEVGISLGLATHTPGLSKAEDLVSKTDQAMYRAKHEGRNKIGIQIENEAEGARIEEHFCINKLNREDITLMPVETPH